MSEHIQPDPAKTALLAQQIVKVLAKEDSATRQRAIAAAMTLLGEAQLDKPKGPVPSAGEHRSGDGPVDLASFFEREEGLKSADHVYLCAAYHYSIHGTAAFSLDELRSIASDAGVVLPDRPDMTLRQGRKKGKRLFQSAGRDAYKPTAAAGALFKDRWQVRPGNKPKEAREAD